MDPETLPAKDFDYLYKKTSEALAQLHLNAMNKIADETTIEFAMYCMREVCVKMVATLMVQHVDPKKCLNQFSEEVSQIIDLLTLPKENMQ